MGVFEVNSKFHEHKSLRSQFEQRSVLHVKNLKELETYIKQKWLLIPNIESYFR